MFRTSDWIGSNTTVAFHMEVEGNAVVRLDDPKQQRSQIFASLMRML